MSAPTWEADMIQAYLEGTKAPKRYLDYLQKVRSYPTEQAYEQCKRIMLGTEKTETPKPVNIFCGYCQHCGQPALEDSCAACN